jgi:hypothetical protein
MKKTFFIVIALVVSMPTFAANWRYVVYLGDTLVYDGSTPPLDTNLAYPPLGESLPVRKAGQEARGVLLNELEYAEQLLQPHVVIIPPTGTSGGKAKAPASGLGTPVQLGF